MKKLPLININECGFTQKTHHFFVKKKFRYLNDLLDKMDLCLKQAKNKFEFKAYRMFFLRGINISIMMEVHEYITSNGYHGCYTYGVSDNYFPLEWKRFIDLFSVYQRSKIPSYRERRPYKDVSVDIYADLPKLKAPLTVEHIQSIPKERWDLLNNPTPEMIQQYENSNKKWMQNMKHLALEIDEIPKQIDENTFTFGVIVKDPSKAINGSDIFNKKLFDI